MPPPLPGLERRRLCHGGVAWTFLVSGALVRPAAAVTFEGQIAATSDAIYRGLSQSFGHPALEADARVSTSGGTVVGAFTILPLSTQQGRSFGMGEAAEISFYAGQNFPLGSTFSAGINAYSHHYVGRGLPGQQDYQEISLQLSYLDLWSFSLSAIPNAVHIIGPYQPAMGQWDSAGGAVRTERYAAWVAATQLQWQVVSQLYLTAGVGYYYMPGVGPECYAQAGCAAAVRGSAGHGYFYGNPGLAYQWRSLRLDVGYFLAGDHAAARIYAYPSASHHVAATLSWRF